MNTQGAPPLELELEADPKAVPPVRRRALRFCAEAGLAEDDCLTLGIALGEALANAVTHGAPHPQSFGRQQRPIALSLWDFRDHLIIHVHDHGLGFDPCCPPYPMPEAAEAPTHGRGLPLMEMLTDALLVCRGCVAEGGSSVFLIKRIAR